MDRVDLECRMWDFMFHLSEKSGRFLDGSYALVNRLLARLLFDETRADLNLEDLKTNARMLNADLLKYKYLLDASYEAAVAGQLPTPHAHVQSVIISLGVSYLSCYSDWSAFSAQTDLIPLRYATFFAGKSWAAVCARGYFYWLHLHARCMFGATEELRSVPVSQTEFQMDYNSSVAPLPYSLLHAAVIVRMHGRTLVQFMRQSCEQRLAKRRLNPHEQLEADKGDSYFRVPDNTSFTGASSPELTVWGNSLLTDGELLNLWMGTRLLIRGCLQVTELYTLFGSVREARAYQDELLRISQRFHLVSCAQLALSLMAHLDLFAQRKWAFELRLRQLNHIATCTVPLEDIVRNLSCLAEKSKDAYLNREDEAAFLRSDSANSLATRHQAVAHDAESAFDDVATDALSSATNPLLAVNVHAFASIFPCSPTRTERDTSAVPPCFPTIPQLISLITGSMHVPRKEIPKRSKTNTQTEAVRKLNETLTLVGGLPLTVCASRILNGVHWPWLLEIIRLVREELLPTSHFLPAAIPIPTSQSSKHENKRNGVDDLLDAFAALNASPSRETHESLTRFTQVKQSLMGSGSESRDTLHTGKTMPPPAPSLNAPRRLADRRASPCSRATCNSRSRRLKTSNESTNVSNIEVPLAAPSSTVPSTPVNVRRAHFTGLPKPMIESQVDDQAFLSNFAYRLAPRKQRTKQRKAIDFYVDPDESSHENPRQTERISVANKQDTAESGPLYDPVEACPSLTGILPRPRNLRLASRWKDVQYRSIHRSPESIVISPPFPESNIRVTEATAAADQLATRLNAAYNRLAGLPVPNLVRPICHWLGLWWLGKDCQSQAGRYFSQSVGIAPTSLYMSILSSRLSESRTTSSTVPTSDGWFHGYCRIRECSIPYHPLRHQDDSIDPITSSLITVVQLCLVDELVIDPRFCSPSSDSSPIDPTHNVPLGLGSKTRAYLVATKFTGISGTSCANLRAESRVIHGFGNGGLNALNTFEQLQSESLDSMQIQDRVRYWKTRYALDSRLEAILAEMRREWFTQDDLAWLLNRNTKTGLTPRSIVLVLDRRLIYLPWEWILTDAGSDCEQVPMFTRSFSLPLVLGHLATVQLALKSDTFPVFDPHRSYYVLNPEANLSFTQQVFQPLFQKLTTWRGVIAREPTPVEVNTGFTEHDLFIYLGHGNGSRFLLHTFNQGLAARAVALILGCSSAKPRWEGRHEPYSSLFNHLLAGCPFVAGLLWDVTDRDMDRFTWRLLGQWLFTNQDPKNGDACKSLRYCLTQASSACKLKYLVGRSVVVYGVPAEPIPDLLLSTPDDFRLEYVSKPL
ncbi:unnamed protein product [Dicrocoelium dendriticum]|nr:unnamed protein product [Dicrocoelium dendriticum]